MQVVIWEAILGNRNKGPRKWNKEGEKLIRQWITEFTGQLGLDFTRAFRGIYRLPERDRKKHVPVGLSITIEDFSWGYRQSYSVKRLQARKQMNVNACLSRGDVSIRWSFIGTACCSQCWSQKWGWEIEIRIVQCTCLAPWIFQSSPSHAWRSSAGCLLCLTMSLTLDT